MNDETISIIKNRKQGGKCVFLLGFFSSFFFLFLFVCVCVCVFNYYLLI